MLTMQDLQQQAQAALPVTPNNGNPNGAHNMPAAGVLPAATGGRYPWLQPSPSMGWVQQMLQRPLMQGYTGPMPGTQEFKDARAAGETPIRDYIQEQRPNLPTLPQRPNGLVAANTPRPMMPTMPGGIMPPVLPTRRQSYRRSSLD